jgi:predicted MFS family arabinose efflux permease
VAGLLVAWIGASDVLLVDAASFAVSAAVFAALVPDLRQRSDRQSAYLDDVKEGLRVVRDDLLLKSLLIQAALLNFVASPLFAVVFPVYSKERYDSPRALGLMLAAFGAGAILGALAYGAIGKRYSRWVLLFGMMLVAGIALSFLVFMPPLWLTAALIAISGFATGSVNPLVTTILQERTLPEMRGRVFGTVSAIASIAAPLGMLIAGAALSGFGTRTVLGAIGGLFVLITLLFLRQRAVWLADEHRHQTPANSASAE